MTDATKSSSPVIKTENSLVNSDAQRRMAELSGENLGAGNFPFISYIEINNAENKKKVMIEGVEQEVSLDPEKVFMITENNEGVYDKMKIGDKLTGTILKFRYQLEKKFEEQSTMPWFRSYEFDNCTKFSKDVIQLVANKEIIHEEPYASFKDNPAYAEKYILWMVVYAFVSELGKVVRFKLKGQSRSSVWEYMAYCKKDKRSTASYNVEFGVETNTEKKIHFNVLTIRRIGDANIEETLALQEELVSRLSNPKHIEENVKIEAEVVNSGPVDLSEVRADEINVNEVPFN